MLLFPRPFGFRLVVHLGVLYPELRPPLVAILSVRDTAHTFTAHGSRRDVISDCVSVRLLDSRESVVTRKTNCSQVVYSVATIRVDVMNFQVIHISLSTLRLVSTNCTSMLVTIEHDLAVVEVR